MKWAELEALLVCACSLQHMYLVKVPNSDKRSEVLVISNSDDNVACLQLIKVLYTLTVSLE